MRRNHQRRLRSDVKRIEGKDSEDQNEGRVSKAGSSQACPNLLNK